MTKFTFPGRQKKYSKFEWNFMCFSGVDYAANLNEAFSLGTETIIMNNDKILQKDKPGVIMKQPVDGWVREFV